MDRLTVEAAVAKFLANGGEIVTIPEVKVVSDSEALNYLERATTGAHGPLSTEESDSAAFNDTLEYRVEL